MNWLDITLLCLAGIGFVKGLFDGIIKQVVSLIALVVAIFFCSKAADRDLFLRKSGGLAERIYLGVGLVSGRRGYDLELYSGFYLDYGGVYSSGRTGYQGGRGDTVERYQPFVWWFFRVAGRFGLYQFAVECAGVRGSWIGLDSSPIKDRISFLL